MTADPVGRIYVGYLFRNLVENRLPWGKRIWSRAPMAVGRYDRSYARICAALGTCVLSLARDSRGRIYVLGGSQAVHEGRDIIVFNPDGRPPPFSFFPSRATAFIWTDKIFLCLGRRGVTVKKISVNFR
jgi:hypothetical protein